MPEAALLVLGRALSAPRVVCSEVAAKAGVSELRVRQVAALLLVQERGPQRSLDLGVMLGRMAGQPVVRVFRQSGLMTLTGRGRERRLSLTNAGGALASEFSTALDRFWRLTIHELPEAHLSDVLAVLRSVSDTPAEASRPKGFPAELIVMLDRLVVKTVDGVLAFADTPGLRDAALRPLLLLTNGPASPTALGSELGVGAPAINVALAWSHRTGLVEWHQRSLRLTDAGERVARRIKLASDVLWLDVERAGGAQVLAELPTLLINMGKRFPANARP